MFQGHKSAIPTNNSSTPHAYITPKSNMYIICTGFIHQKAVTTTNIAITVTGGKYIYFRVYEELAITATIVF